LYEYVPITMDAVNVAPNPQYCQNDPAVGRFWPAAANAVPNDPHKYTNEWADDLFDFVTARNSPSNNRWPDMPQSIAQVQNDPTIPLSDQDGPVKGEETQNNDLTSLALPIIHDALWVHWQTMGAPTPLPVDSRSGDPLSTSSLVPGIVNVNTAPPVVLRMLPLIVDNSSGFANSTGGSVAFGNTTTNVIDAQRSAVKNIYTDLSDPLQADLTPNNANSPGGVAKAGRAFNFADQPPFGFNSLFSLETPDPTAKQRVPIIPGTTTYGNNDLMYLGMLNPFSRPPVANDLTATHLNLTRISNLVSPRSDVFTVYVTVQAWTYVGDIPGARQQDDTRLVGEKRSSFIVDRSKINGEHFKPEDLIILPIDQE
jgi:hypothetical protein